MFPICCLDFLRRAFLRIYISFTLCHLAEIDHDYWGRAEEQNVDRPTLYYNESMPAADLYGAVAGALAASSIAFNKVEKGWAHQILSTAEMLYSWGAKSGGKYSNFYTRQTKSIYPSTDYYDSLAWAAGWLWRATGNTTYLEHAHKHWIKGEPDVYPGWDSLWVAHAVHMVTIAAQGQTVAEVPGLQDYQDFVKNTFLRCWIDANGTQDIIKTPRGLHYPKWNQWANLAFSSQAAALALLHAKYEQDPIAKAEQIAFGRSQIDYALGVTSLRSYVVGYGPFYPTRPHHPSASCPDEPQPCGKAALESEDPNPQILFGALVGGPAGIRKNQTDPDNSYKDKRTDYVTNEAANDCELSFYFRYYYYVDIGYHVPGRVYLIIFITFYLQIMLVLLQPWWLYTDLFRGQRSPIMSVQSNSAISYIYISK